MIQHVGTLKPTRVIEAERALTATQAETFEQWKARQTGVETAVSALDVAYKASVVLTRLKDLESPGVLPPGGIIGRAAMSHLRFNSSRASCGLPVRRELVKDKQWGEPARRVEDRPTSFELKGFRYDAPKALPEDWEAYDVVVDPDGSRRKVYRTRVEKLTRRANRLGLASPTVSMDSQSDVLERMKTQHLVRNEWVPISPVLPVFPAGRVGIQERLPVGISPFSAADQPSCPGPCAVPNLLQTQGMTELQRSRVFMARGPVRPPVTC